MKKILVLIVISFSIKSHCQDNYRVSYTINFTIDTAYVNREFKKRKSSSSSKEAVRIKMREDFFSALDKSKHIKFHLDFNNNSSKFYLPEKIDTKEFRIFKRFSRYKGQFYSFKDSVFHELNAFGQNFIIKLPPPNWKITQTSKKIGNYQCYKAITKKKVDNKFYEIFAWFSPKLPFNFGPRGYHGLPGLILRLDVGNLSYIIHDIEKINSIKLKKPNNGKKISLAEFNVLSKEIFKKRKKEFN